MRPTREHSTRNGQTYFVTSSTPEKPYAELFIKNLYAYREKEYLLHEFVLMKDHFHVIISPAESLEKAVQFIKGGFSYKAKKVLGSNTEFWQKGFDDHRIRDEQDYRIHRTYIHGNPVRKGYCARPGEYLYSSAFSGFELDPVPQGLKPIALAAAAAAEAAPSQSKISKSKIQII